MSVEKLEECRRDHGDGSCWEHYFLNKNGYRVGESFLYHENGNVEEHSFWKEGDYHGEYKSYHDNGKLQKHCFYKDGELHGEYKSYYRGCKLEMHYFFNNSSGEELSEYVDDINNITDDEFMNLTMVFGDNFFASKTFTGAAS